MSVPRTRRYPRRPITKAQPMLGNVHMPTPMMIATALAAHYGKRTSHAYSESLRATTTASVTLAGPALIAYSRYLRRQRGTEDA